MIEERIDIDRATELAWARFQDRLIHHLTAMADADVLVVSTEGPLDPDDATGPHIRFHVRAGDTVRAEASGNASLAGEHRLSPVDAQRLLELGWVAPGGTPPDEHDPGSTSFSIEAPRALVELLVVQATRSLREVYAVPHPALLDPPELGLGLSVTTEPSGTADEPGGAGSVEEWEARRPADRDELGEMVAASLRPRFGGTVHRDDDGDIPVHEGSAVVFVRVLEEPVVQLFSFVVQDVGDKDRARDEVEDLNRDSRFLRYHLSGDTVFAVAELPAMPFVPRHLTEILETMATTLDCLDDSLAQRIGGRRYREPNGRGDDDESDNTLTSAAGRRPRNLASQDLPPELETLLRKNGEAGGGLPPGRVAELCDDDASVIVGLIRQAEDQAITWHHRWEEAVLAREDEAAQASRRELRAWEETIRQLRAALKLVVTRYLRQ